MRPYRCGSCEQLVFFDNSACLRCGSELGYLPEERELAALQHVDGSLEPIGRQGQRWLRCANAISATCNWLVPAGPPGAPAGLCASCRLTTVRPNDGDPLALAAFARAESAKRRLLHQLTGLDLPILDRVDDPDRGLAFELLSSRGHPVTTGHKRGVITLDLSESDDAHREFVRQQLGEAYRTVLGHLRHEIAHYYWPILVGHGARIGEFRKLFGDETADYRQALADHYGRPAPETDTWSSTHVSQYATMHPWEDWAETFAHYLHIRDGLETAAAFGLMIGEPARSVADTAWTPPDGTPMDELSIGPMIGRWLSLAMALNAMSRSIGEGDLYPFVLSPTVIDKLDFVHQAVTNRAG